MHRCISRPVRHLARLPVCCLLLFGAACWRTAFAHGDVADRVAAPREHTTPTSVFLEHSYRVFSDLALRCPTSRQADVMAAAEAIYRVVWDWRPSPASAEEVQQVEADTRAFWRVVEREYPTVRVAVTPATLSVQPRRPIPAVKGLERCILLRLTNAGSAELSVTAQIGDAPIGTAVLPSLRRDPDDARWLIVPIAEQRLGAQAVEIRLTGAGTVRVPVVVSEPAVLRGRLLDRGTGEPWPGRVQVCGSDGVLRHGEAFKANSTLSEKPVVFRPASYRLPFFYSDGTFEVIVPCGPTRVTLERGFEHTPVSQSMRLKAGETRAVALASGRSIDLWTRGWVSGDTHVHWVRNSWDVNEELSLLGLVQRAEDVRVVNNLTLYQYRSAEAGGAFIKPDHYPMGPVPGMCDASWHVQMAEEYRNDNHYGHINLLGLQQRLDPIATGAGSGGPPGTADYPTNRQVVLEARRQGGISVEAHNIGPCNASAVPVNVALGLSDSLDQLDAEHYYRFLNCGFHLGLSNGSDHPARVVGCARVYARTAQRGGEPLPFTYERWLDAVRRGRTFTTSGPLLLLKVNGVEPGATLDLPQGARLEVEVAAFSRYPLGTVEIVANGVVLKSVRTSARSRTLRLRLRADESRWFCARASRNGVWNAILAPDVAHTSAVYTRIGGREVLKAEAAQGWIANVKEHIGRLETTGVFVDEQQRRQALDEARQGLRRYEEIARLAAAPTATARPPPSRPVRPADAIRLTPVVVDRPVQRADGMREGQDLSRIAFHLQAPWMSGPVELRFPETMRSSMGMHFLDHYLSTLKPLYEWRRYPEWESDPRTGALSYDVLTPEGLQIAASVRPSADTVELAFTVTNRTGAAVDRVEANCCLDLGPCPELNAKHDLTRLLMSFGGTVKPLAETTPTPAQMGRDPWLLILSVQGGPAFTGPKDSPTWWRVDQLTDRNLMAAVSADGKHLLGYTWSVEPEALMSNCGNPCLHTGMGFSPRLESGQSFTWRGRIYCLPNDPTELVRRYEADQAEWRTQP